MVKRGKVPKTRTSLRNKQLTQTSKNLAKKGGPFLVRQIVTFVIIRPLCAVMRRNAQAEVSSLITSNPPAT